MAHAVLDVLDRKRLNPVRNEKNRRFVQEMGKSCTRRNCGLTKQWGRSFVAPPLALYPSQQLQQEALPISSFHRNECAQCPIIEGIEHDGKIYTTDSQAITKQGMLNTLWLTGIEHGSKKAGNRPRFVTISVWQKPMMFIKRQGLCARSWRFCARFRYFRTKSSLFDSTLHTHIL